MVLERFDCVVQSCGTKVAIACQDQTLTYTELNHQINQLAQVLLRHGIQPQDRVGLFLDRGLTLVVALLALLRIGAVYTPLDPAYPQDRLNFMVADVQPRCIVTTQALQPRLATRVPFVLCLDHNGLTSSAGDPTAPALAPLDPKALAYIMYTSGSTVDLLPRLENGGFWDQTAIAGNACLTSPNPMAEAPATLIFIAAFSSRSFSAEQLGHRQWRVSKSRCSKI